MSEQNELVLKPINDLLKESFFIPAYQRGYRWTNRQVIELLEDVYEFCSRRKTSDDEFYCLQPIVVKPKGDHWELVDGQQRLTTILLILGFFNLRLAEKYQKQLYSIEYETRPGSEQYLKELDEEKKSQNIDYFHMYESYSQIDSWFEDKDHKINDIESAFLNDVKVIWYQINEDVDATSVFTRLNVGKIPLTNAELVKALLLKSSNFESPTRHLSQLKIAQEWDEMERTLQRDEFWFFANNEKKEANRIEFILNLVANSLPNHDEVSKKDPNYIFLTFNSHLSTGESSIEDEWFCIKSYFMTIREWFEDRELFHLIGLLVLNNQPIGSLMDTYKSCHTKSEFKQKLINLEFRKLFGDSVELHDFENKESLKGEIEGGLREINYESSSRQQIKHALVLFNIASLLNNPSTDARFQFSNFKLESWDIEHIRSVSSYMPQSKERQKEWLMNILEYFSCTEEWDKLSEENRSIIDVSCQSANDILELSTFDSEAFKEVYHQILSIFSPDNDDEIDNSLGNLTLLDQSTNRSYQNSIFPVKRKKIIALDKKATFVPLCTKNVFLKYYSESINNMLFWSANDTEAHFNAMAEMYVSFFADMEVK
jgi:hypothetical protein